MTLSTAHPLPFEQHDLLTVVWHQALRRAYAALGLRRQRPEKSTDAARNAHQ